MCMKNTLNLFNKHKHEIKEIAGYYSRSSLADFVIEVFNTIESDIKKKGKD